VSLNFILFVPESNQVTLSRRSIALVEVPLLNYLQRFLTDRGHCAFQPVQRITWQQSQIALINSCLFWSLVFFIVIFLLLRYLLIWWHLDVDNPVNYFKSLFLKIEYRPMDRHQTCVWFNNNTLECIDARSKHKLCGRLKHFRCLLTLL